jgi:hypothetical protein
MVLNHTVYKNNIFRIILPTKIFFLIFVENSTDDASSLTKNQLHSYEEKDCSFLAPGCKVIYAPWWILLTIIMTQKEAWMTQPYVLGSYKPKPSVFMTSPILSQMNPLHPFHPITFCCFKILMLSSNLHLGSVNGLFPSGLMDYWGGGKGTWKCILLSNSAVYVLICSTNFRF